MRKPLDRHRRRGLAGLGVRARRALFRLLDFCPLWIGLTLALGTWLLAPTSGLFTRSLEAGSIAQRDFIAPRELLVTDEDTTAEKRQRAREEVLPVYDFDAGAGQRLGGQLSELFTAGRGQSSPAAAADGAGGPLTAEELVEMLAASGAVKLPEEQLARLAAADFPVAVEEALGVVLKAVARRGVVADKTTLLENIVGGITLRNLATGTEVVERDLYNYLAVGEELDDFVASLMPAPSEALSAGDRRLTREILTGLLRPNLHPNLAETQVRREAAGNATKPVFNRIREGQVIVREGDELTSMQVRAINGWLGDRGASSRLLPFLGSFLLLVLATAVLWLGSSGEETADHSRQRLLSESLILLLMGIVGGRFGFFLAAAVSGALESPPFNVTHSYLYAVPFASVALVTFLLFSRRAALLLATVFAVLASRLVESGDGSWLIVYCLIGSFAAIFAMDRLKFRQRSSLLRVGLAIGAANVVAILLLAALANEPFRSLEAFGFDLACGLLGGLLSAAVASFAVSVFELIFGVTTHIKLVELANTNLPLLRQLALEAPGTFQHSLTVASLAKAACDAIQADSILAYTAALYHDVGKMFRPDYFIENQRSGHNPHDTLSASMSVLVLVNHIKEGLELARQHHLPQPILDAIAQHHGTRRINYFYNRAVERNDPECGEVDEEKFRYPGPRPQNKVMGVLMLADGIEAASRSINDPAPAKLRSVVTKIVEDCLGDGQLGETDLTLGDIGRVSEAFLRVLATLFHQRIDYPGFDFNVGGSGAEPLGQRADARIAS